MPVGGGNLHRNALPVAVALVAATAFVPVADAHQDKIPGALVLEGGAPDRPRCYVFSAPLTASQGFDTVQLFVEANGKLAGGVPEGTGPTNTRAATADKATEGVLEDVPYAPHRIPVEETVVGEGSGLQHPDWRFNTASDDPGFAANHSDTRLTPVEFARTCV